MTVYLRRFKNVEKTDECDGGVAAPVGDVVCTQPFDSAPSGMGNAVPIGSADRWDNVLGIGFSTPKKRKYKIKKRK